MVAGRELVAEKEREKEGGRERGVVEV